MTDATQRKIARITDQQINDVLQLCGSELSPREIAKRVGISRTSVAKICSSDFKPHKSKEAGALDWNSGWPQGIGTGPISRCPSCGAKVFGGCAACYMQKRMARRKILRKARQESGQSSTAGQP